MADPIAIASVVSTATVAIAVPFLGARLERQRLQYQGEQERFAELRTLADGAAERLVEGQTVLNRLILSAVPENQESRVRATIGDRFTQLAVDVFRDNVRLSLRLGGEHEVVAAHGDAMQSFHSGEGLWRTKQQTPSITAHLNPYGEATGRFLAAASRILAVPALPGSQTSRGARPDEPGPRASDAS